MEIKSIDYRLSTTLVTPYTTTTLPSINNGYYGYQRIGNSISINRIDMNLFAMVTDTQAFDNNRAAIYWIILLVDKQVSPTADALLDVTSTGTTDKNYMPMINPYLSDRYEILYKKVFAVSTSTPKAELVSIPVNIIQSYSGNTIKTNALQVLYAPVLDSPASVSFSMFGNVRIYYTDIELKSCGDYAMS